ncbi:MAG: terminase [candidate division CPR1 bacterium GW2011_GWC1_49_13]|uniref:Terminase n=1 Tax=candidate division CPR1 bacterium GW2011_GWC1_49_13 TaxID=1618342 RepID=A0A0G1XSU5_9BACT|nr:MAG: terminase [candidate division CPR1 bacterium GW2011_GWC1_49_13]
MTAAPVIEVRPQSGMQEMALSSAADIEIIGGAAGAGKTWTLLVDPVRHAEVEGFAAVMFRRQFDMITKPGGLWAESLKLYPLLDAEPRMSAPRSWRFPSGAEIQFAHLQYDSTAYAWHGAQIAGLYFDQLEQFTAFQFFYLLSRNRSVCGVRPYVRASCNPVPEDDPVGGWLHQFVSWWIDPATGYAIADRAGVVRWFVRAPDDALVWADTEDELRQQFPAAAPKSVTFVPGTIYENPALLERDPGYLANLLAQPLVERERLLGGNWKIRATAGTVFNRAWFEIVDAVPAVARRVRWWDKAATPAEAGAHAYSCGVRMAEAGGISYVEDVVRGQWSAGQRETVMGQTAEADGRAVRIWMEQEPGSGGKESAENSIRRLRGYIVRAEPSTGDKFERAQPFAAQAEAGNVKLVRGPWNEAYLRELHNADPRRSRAVLDQMDASAGAFNKLAKMGRGLAIV